MGSLADQRREVAKKMLEGQKKHTAYEQAAYGPGVREGVEYRPRRQQINEDEAYDLALYTHISGATGEDFGTVKSRYPNATSEVRAGWEKEFRRTYPKLFVEDEAGRSGIDQLRYEFASVTDPTERSESLKRFKE